MIQIQPWESSLIKEIEKAILVSDLGITPNNDGKVIRLIFPELTEDRRKELAKEVKKKGDNANVAIRNVRRDANDLFKKQNKAGEISDDELKGTEDDIQKLTDKYVGIIDATVEEKTKEIVNKLPGYVVKIFEEKIDNELKIRTRMMEILRDEQINIYEYINEKQLEKLNPQGNLRIAIEKFGWINKPITA